MYFTPYPMVIIINNNNNNNYHIPEQPQPYADFHGEPHGPKQQQLATNKFPGYKWEQKRVEKYVKSIKEHLYRLHFETIQTNERPLEFSLLGSGSHPGERGVRKTKGKTRKNAGVCIISIIFWVKNFFYYFLGQAFFYLVFFRSNSTTLATCLLSILKSKNWTQRMYRNLTGPKNSLKISRNRKIIRKIN